jgi:hypothetical protein
LVDIVRRVFAEGEFEDRPAGVVCRLEIDKSVALAHTDDTISVGFDKTPQVLRRRRLFPKLLQEIADLGGRSAGGWRVATS